jgi:hypothetical protein
MHLEMSIYLFLYNTAISLAAASESLLSVALLVASLHY